jgi:hypothetical protein
MKRVDLIEATMQGWARLNPSQRKRFLQGVPEGGGEARPA